MTLLLIPYCIAALFGLVFGSFLNVCILRIPRAESIVSPRSRCPRCGAPIRSFDNIPVLSYLLLRARCRSCKAKISPLYPAVELLTSAWWVASFWEYQLSPDFIKWVIFGMLLIILVFTDLIDRRLPHRVTIFGISAGLLLSLLVPIDSRPLPWLLSSLGFEPEGWALSLLGAIAGAMVGGGLFYAVGEAFYYLGGKQREYLGFGDVMLMLMIGTFLGIPLTLLTILLGSLGGTLIALPFVAASSRFRHYEWPYGTFLGVAALYASLGGKTLLDWYLRFSGLM